MNKGLLIEKDFILKLNNIYVKDLKNDFLKSIIFKSFPGVNENDLIACKKVNGHQKADILVRIGDKTVFYSIKSGTSNSVHQEDVYAFCKFLLKIGLEKRYIKTILLYHFGDDTLNGTGSKRMTADEAKVKYHDELLSLNKVLSNRFIIRNVAYRALFQKNDYDECVDYIIYGNTEYGIIKGREEILTYLSTHFDFHIIPPHFGSLVYQPHARNQIDETKRRSFQLKWLSIVSDLEKIDK